MESTITPGTSAHDNASPSTDTPFASKLDAAADEASTSAAADDGGSAGAAKAHELVERAARNAHQAIDAVAARVGSVVDGLDTSRLAETRDDWVGATRDAIAERPLAAIGIALLLGAGLASLRSRDR